VLTDANYVNTSILHNKYTTLALSDIYPDNAGYFYHPDYVDSIWYLQRQLDIITLGGVYYNYARFMDNAVTDGLLTVTNNQFVDRFIDGVWQNPYQKQAVFAISPPLHSYTGRSCQVNLSSSLWFTNNAAAVSSLAMDYGDGSGYHTILMDQPINISYTDTGTKIWKFCLTLADGTALYSQTIMKVQPEPNSNFASDASNRIGIPGKNTPGIVPQGYSPNDHTPELLIADAPYDGERGQGWITVDYANSDYKLRKPLIVVEGFDPGYLIQPEDLYGITNYYTFIASVSFAPDLYNLLHSSTAQEYDIIYVDWKKGADYLQRNGLLLERVIRWVNEKKAADVVSTEPNVVLGQSMGGVISRWALKDMEQNGLDHHTRLFIS